MKKKYNLKDEAINEIVDKIAARDKNKNTERER
jgi:hypothetical protein